MMRNFITYRCALDLEEAFCHTINLTQWNGSIALFYYPKFKPIEMWVMHEPNKGNITCHRWTKHLSIGPLEGIYKIPLAFWKSDELLLREDKQGLISYNILTKKVRSLHLDMGDMPYFRAFSCVKSLIISLT